MSELIYVYMTLEKTFEKMFLIEKSNKLIYCNSEFQFLWAPGKNTLFLFLPEVKYY